jgi:hypothetical protein
MHGIANPENRGFKSLPLLQLILGEVLMATHVVWDHEWQIRALPPRPNNARVVEWYTHKHVFSLCLA